MVSVSDLLRYRFFRQLLVTLWLLFVVAILAVSALQFRMYRNATIEEVSRMSVAQLSEMSRVTALLYEQVTALANQLVVDPVMARAGTSRQVNYRNEYLAYLHMNRLVATYPFLAYISVYNGYTGRYITTRGPIAARDGDVLELVVSLVGDEGAPMLPRVATRATSSGLVEDRVVSYVSSFRARSLEGPSAVVLHVDTDYLHATLGSLFPGPGHDVLVVDQAGRVVLHSNPDSFLADARTLLPSLGDLSSLDAGGARIVRRDGEEFFLAHVNLREPAWLFLIQRSIPEMLGGIRATRMYSFIAAAALGVIGILLAGVISVRLYIPFYALVKRAQGSGLTEGIRRSPVDEIAALSAMLEQGAKLRDSMRSALDQSMVFVRRAYTNALLFGEWTMADELSDQLKEIERQFQGAYYRILLIVLDRGHRNDTSGYSVGPTRRRVDEDMLDLVRSGLPPSLTAAGVANVGENQVACVLLSQHSKLTTDVEKSLPTLQEEIRVREGGSVALVVSDAVSDVRQLSRALRNATDRARDRFFLGPDAVILGDERRRESVSVYPGKLERKLIEAVRGGDRGEIVSLVAEFMAVLRTLSYERAIAFSERLLSALVNEFRKPPTESIVPDDVFVQLRAGSYITSVEEVFLSACLTVAAELESRREVSKQDVMETVRAYVDQHFNEYQMSLEHLSTRFQMSRDHLGRRFLECFGVHFTEYVTAKRVELAKQMLCEQSESVAEIGERTGFPNRGYFATIFKRYTGHTPTSYRAHCGRSDR